MLPVTQFPSIWMQIKTRFINPSSVKIIAVAILGSLCQSVDFACKRESNVWPVCISCASNVPQVSGTIIQGE